MSESFCALYLTSLLEQHCQLSLSHSTEKYCWLKKCNKISPNFDFPILRVHNGLLYPFFNGAPQHIKKTLGSGSGKCLWFAGDPLDNTA